MEAWIFFKRTVRMVFVGTKAYYLWCAFLLAIIGAAITFYTKQLDAGLIVTNMRDQVSWGLYIGNFTYLVGVAAAAVLLVIPAYIYHFDPIKEIVVLGELLAASAIIMALMFVLADLGRPDRFWHIIPFIGILSFPNSLLAWDVTVLNGYLVLNTIVLYSDQDVLRQGTDQEFRHSACFTFHSLGGGHPYRDCFSIQRARRPTLLERLHPGAPFSGQRLLLRAGHGPDYFPGFEKDGGDENQERGAFQGR